MYGPSFSLTPDTFPVLLARLDECIAFIQSHVSTDVLSIFLSVCLSVSLSLSLSFFRLLSLPFISWFLVFLYCSFITRSPLSTLLAFNSSYHEHWALSDSRSFTPSRAQHKVCYLQLRLGRKKLAVPLSTPSRHCTNHFFAFLFLSLCWFLWELFVVVFDGASDHTQTTPFTQLSCDLVQMY